MYLLEKFIINNSFLVQNRPSQKNLLGLRQIRSGCYLKNFVQENFWN